MIHTIHTHKRGGGLVTLKIDLEKAYDQVNSDFLQITQYDDGIPLPVFDLIMWGVQSACISILWNGSKLPPFPPQRSLRQGDPSIITYLFVLCMEQLVIHIQKLADEGSWYQVQITKEGIGISHLFFADDVFFFVKLIRSKGIWWQTRWRIFAMHQKWKWI